MEESEEEAEDEDKEDEKESGPKQNLDACGNIIIFKLLFQVLSLVYKFITWMVYTV